MVWSLAPAFCHSSACPSAAAAAAAAAAVAVAAASAAAATATCCCWDCVAMLSTCLRLGVCSVSSIVRMLLAPFLCCAGAGGGRRPGLGAGGMTGRAEFRSASDACYAFISTEVHLQLCTMPIVFALRASNVKCGSPAGSGGSRTAHLSDLQPTLFRRSFRSSPRTADLLSGASCASKAQAPHNWREWSGLAGARRPTAALSWAAGTQKRTG